MVDKRFSNAKGDREYDKFVESTFTDTALRIQDSDAAKDIRFDANDSAPNYVGLNKTNGAATTDTDWIIYKFTYSGSNVTRIQKALGAWDSRTGLF